MAGGGQMGALMRAMDWSRTPLGPVAQWSLSLRMMVSFLLANRFPLLLWWGPQYVQIYNDAYRPVLGAKHPESMGQPCSECWAEIWQILKPLIDTPFEGGSPTWMEDFELEVNRHGFIEETHFTIAYSPVPDAAASNGVGGVLATVHEITEKIVGERRIAILRELGARSGLEAKTAEEPCRVAAEILTQNPKDVPFALIYLLDRDGRKARRVACSGIADAHLLGPEVLALQGEGQDGVWPLAEAVHSEKTVTIDDLPTRFGTGPSGQWPGAPQSAVIVPIRSNAAHQLAGLLVGGVSPRLRLDKQYYSFYELAAAQIATAIANARAYEEERLRAEALAEIDRAKTTFFSNVSHEFRTPLTLMLGPVKDAAENPQVPESTRAQLELAHRNSLRLLKLVNSLLDFSRIEAGRVQASYEPTDLTALTRDLASTFRSAMERAGLAYEVHCEALPELVYLDREMWEKIVLNLLSNAFKYTLQGSVALRLQADNGGAVLAVSDTGIGIPEQELPQLFERFHRVEGSAGRTQEGSGIGLALVHELVRLHGGAIEVESVLGRGTTFRVRLPFGTAHLPPERIKASRPLASTASGARAYVQEALRWLPEQSSLPTSSPPALERASASDQRFASTFGARIVLADDNADMRAYVQDLLSANYRVQAVGDGKAALEAIRAAVPELVLTDVMMPRLDGFGLLKAIRADESLRDIQVILLSARAGEESRLEGLGAGADDYLVKPFSARELLCRVGALLELARMRRETEERFRAFVSATSEAIFRMSPDWTVMRHLQGRSFMEGTSEPSRGWLEKYIHPDDQPRVLSAIRAAVLSKSVFELEHRVKRVDGSMGWTLSRAIPLKDAQGDIVEWFGAASDVTERKQTEQALKEREEQLRLATDAADVGLWDVDLVTDTLYWPARVKAMFGISPHVVVSMADFYAGLHPGDRERVSAAFAAAIDPQQRALYDVEYRTIGKEDGELRWVAAKGRGIFDHAGRCVRVLGTAIDISERKSAEASALRQRQILEMVASGAPLGDTLDELMRFLEQQQPGVRCGLLIVSEDGTHFRRGSAPSLPEQYQQAFDGAAIGSPYLGPCSEAVVRGATVTVRDVGADTRYASRWREALLSCGVRAARSTPVRGLQGRILGSLAFYYRDPCDPSPFNPQLLQIGTHLAAIALERDRAECALRQSREQLQTIVDDSPTGVYLIDQDLRFCQVNPSALPTFGGMPDLIGRNFAEVMHVLWPEPHAEEIVAIFRRTLESGQPFHAPEYISKRRDRGVTEYYDWQIHRVPLPDGRHGVVCYFRDISEQVQARRALECADRQKDEFLAMLSHELRNPLAPIGNASELLARIVTKDARAQPAISMIRRQVTQMTRLVDDLLDVSRITLGRIALQRRPVDLSSVIAQAVEMIEPQLREYRHELSVLASSYEPLYVSGDPARLLQCVGNILSNAVKYTDPGGEIRIRSRADGANAIIEISDNGTGIAPELLPHVFDLFVQGDRTLDRAKGGLGIGLSLVKRLVQMHEGQILVHSEGIGRGSTFEIRLPRIARPSGSAGTNVQIQVRRRRILIVDDNRDAAQSLAMLLNVEGHETQVAYSAKEALERARAFQPDISLLDIGLPEMNGYELAQRMRADRNDAGPILIALTGYGQAEDRARALSAGFADHLVKPVDLSALERSLAALEGENDPSMRKATQDWPPR